MELTWYGLSCFRLVERGLATLVTDPYDHHQTGYEALKLKADIVTVSNAKPEHNYTSAVKGDPHIITGPGEYEIGSVFITGVQTNGHNKQKDDEPRNTLYMFDFNGLTIAHLGQLNRVPTQTEVEGLGTVHIALVPVGGGDALNAAKAAEVISLLEPSIVIPMHYAHLMPSSAQSEALTAQLAQPSILSAQMAQNELPSASGVQIAAADRLDPLSKFLKEMGLKEVETLPSFKVTGPGSLPEETRVVVLEYQHN
jgi:L-ascorbate metabolism protein UlaG (beta-lactamase superfamily)